MICATRCERNQFCLRYQMKRFTEKKVRVRLFMGGPKCDQFIDTIDQTVT